MAKNKSLLTSPIFLVSLAAVGIFAFTTMDGSGAAASSGLKAKSGKRTTSKRRGDIEFTKQDDLAKFDRVQISVKNAFMPVVAKRGGIGGGSGLANSIGSELTGGEGNWVYTGTAETDGSRMALLENRTSGDAVFLHAGERWKSAYVVRVNSDSVVLRGPGGMRTFGLVDDEPIKLTETRTASNGNSPARVNVPRDLRGPIGSGGQGGFGPLSAVPQGPNSNTMEPVITFGGSDGNEN